MFGVSCLHSVCLGGESAALAEFRAKPASGVHWGLQVSGHLGNWVPSGCSRKGRWPSLPLIAA